MTTEPGIATRAGTSAQAQFERRRARHQERMRRQRPWLLTLSLAGTLLGGWALLTEQPSIVWILAAAISISSIGRAFATPMHVTAWAIGAAGEGRTAAALQPLAAEGFRIIHDLPIPRSRANIDHVVIGPPGIFVIETKSVKGKLEIRGQEIFVAGRRRNAWLDEVRRELAVVRSILGDDLVHLGIDVAPLICVHRADLPLFRSTAADIPILSAKSMTRRLREAAPVLSSEAVDELAQRLERSRTTRRSKAGDR